MLLQIILIVLLIAVILVLLSGIRYIPNNRMGIVERHFGLRGSVKSGFIAMGGEAGFQPQVLRGGLHYLMPIQHTVHIAPLVTITQGKIGYIFARDGAPLAPDQTLSPSVRPRVDRYRGVIANIPNAMPSADKLVPTATREPTPCPPRATPSATSGARLDASPGTAATHAACKTK